MLHPDLARALDLVEVLFLGFLCLAFVIFLRSVSKFPSELDRVGADISLYACGSAFSLFAAAFLEGKILSGADQGDALFLGIAGILLSVMGYFAALFCSETLRANFNPRLAHGIETWTDLATVLDDQKGALYFKLALALGLLPGVFFFALDILRSLTR